MTDTFEEVKAFMEANPDDPATFVLGAAFNAMAAAFAPNKREAIDLAMKSIDCSMTAAAKADEKKRR